MSIRFSTLLTAGLLGAFLIASTLAPVQAGDGEGCSKDKKGGTTSLVTTVG